MRTVIICLLLLGGTFRTAAQTYSCYFQGEYIIGPACVGSQLNYTYQSAYLPSTHPGNSAFNWIAGMQFNWSASGGTVYGAGNANCQVNWSDACHNGNVHLSVVITYGHESVPNATLSATITCDLPVTVQHLTDIEVAHINGDHSMIECYNSDPVYFGADAGPCVSGFIWGAYDPANPSVVNTGWTVEPIGSGLTVKITPDGHTPALIKVYAYDCMGSPGTTAQVLIQRGCIENKTYQYATTNLPHNLAVTDFIRINPLPGEYVSVQPGQAVFFKAENYIEITPGFKTEDNSLFQARIGYCDDCYGWRIANQQPDTATEMSSGPVEPKLSVYPNPCQVTTILNLPASDEKYTVTIADLNGMIVMQLSCGGGQTEISTENFSNGVYTVRATGSSGVTLSNQFIKTD